METSFFFGEWRFLSRKTEGRRLKAFQLTGRTFYFILGFSVVKKAEG